MAVYQLEDIVPNSKKIFSKEHCFNQKLSPYDLFEEYCVGVGVEPFHIYNSTNDGDKAFVILSNDTVPSVLAYSDENSFDVNNMPPAVKYWLETYIISSQNTVNDSVQMPLNVSYREEGVAPLLGKIIWGQARPFNNSCPTYRGEKTLTGCVATAMAQVMKFYSFPEQAHGQINYRTSSNKIVITHDFSKDHFYWNDMLDSYIASYSSEQASSVAALMASCGAAVKMDYGTSGQGGSGAYQSDLIKGYIENYGYDKDASLVIRSYCSTEDWHRLLIEELNAGRPVNYAGSSMRDGGHSFVIDGYKVGYNQYPDYHVNWGWDGSCDGYYQIANLHPEDEGNFATSAAFSQSQQMTIGVMPDDGVDKKDYVFVSSKLNCGLSKVKKKGTLAFNVSSLYNCSYKRYKGYISVALKDDREQLFVLDKGNRYQLEYLEGTGNLELTCSIPIAVSEGRYKACLVYRQLEEDTWKEVLSSSYPQVEVTEGAEEIYSDDVWSEIGCSEIELIQENDKSRITANVYELINLQEEPFVGELSFVIADENGFPMFSFGEKSNVPELGFNDFLTEPIRVSGTFDKALPDGLYRLYISSKRLEQTTESFVVYNNLDVIGAQTQELYYHVYVRNSVLNIDGKEFVISPTHIYNHLRHDYSNSLFSIEGIRMQGVHQRGKGIYIQRVNGDIKKMVR